MKRVDDLAASCTKLRLFVYTTYGGFTEFSVLKELNRIYAYKSKFNVGVILQVNWMFYYDAEVACALYDLTH